MGVRTSSLIIPGTCAFMVAALGVSTAASNPSRVIGQVITGIGFLGAGVMLARDGVVLGVTSAATIWTLAAIGVTVAIGHTFTAIKLSVVVVALLVGVDILEACSQSMTRGLPRKYQGWRGKHIP